MSPRRTRSQSREPPPSYQKAKASNLSGSAWRDTGKNLHLSPVVERSPRASQDRTFPQDNDEGIPESPDPEGNINISGITAIERDFAVSEDENEELEEAEDDDPILLLEEFQSLEDAAANLMSQLISKHSDSTDIVEAALEWKTNPKAPGSKVLRRRYQKLAEAMKVYTSDLFIDVAKIQQLIPSLPASQLLPAWQPQATLYLANCARLAAEVLFTDATSESFKELVGFLNSTYPSPFLQNVLAGSVSAFNGVSEKAVFRLAVEIRTQWFILELESQSRGAKNVDALRILKNTFFFEQGWESLDPRWLRGFSLAQTFETEDQGLPARFQEDVLDRFREIKIDLFERPGAPNLDGLRMSYKWHRFAMRVVEFLYGRNDELRWEINNQARFSAVKSELEDSIANGKQEQERSDREEEDYHSVPEEDARQESPARQKVTTPRSQARESSVPQSLKSPQRRAPSGSSPAVGAPGPSNSPRKRLLDDEPTELPKAKRRRSKGNSMWTNKASLDYVFNNKQASPAQNQSPNARRTTANSLTSHPQGEQDEIFESQEHGFDDGETTLIHHDDDLQLDGPLEQSRTPPGSARTRQVSYNPGPEPASTHGSPQTHHRRDGPKTTPRRTLLDHQTGASRVSDIDEDESQSAGSSRFRDIMPQSVRRAANDSDDAFEEDDREIDIANRRAEKPQPRHPVAEQGDESTESDAAHQLQQSLASSHQTQDSPRSTFDIQISPRRANGRSNRSSQSSREVMLSPARRVHFQAQETEAPSSTQLQTQNNGPTPLGNSRPTAWATLNAIPNPNAGELARRNTFAHRSKGGRWSEEEEVRFRHLMQRWPRQWAEILRQDELAPEADGGPILSRRGRNQVNLKDHARDVLARILLRGEPVPPEFEGVRPARRVGLP